MGRFARIAVLIVVAVVVLGGIAGAGLAFYRHHEYGTVYSESQLGVTVDRGGRFTLAVPDRGGSIGDSWTPQADTGGLLTAEGTRLRHANLIDRVRDPLLGGGQGTRFFVYQASAAGTTAVSLSFCSQGCDNPGTQNLRKTVTWTVTVR